MLYLLAFILFFRLSQEYLLTERKEFKTGDQIIVRGCLENQPQARGEEQSFYLSGIRIVTGKEYSYADCLEAEGTIQSYQYQGRDFFYLDNPEITFWKAPWGKKSLGWLRRLGLKTQQKLIKIYQRWLPEPESSLISGIVLGAKSVLPEDFYQQLKTTGTIHVVVASGYNLTVISRAPVESLAWVLGRNLALVLGWLLIWFYVLIAGGEPPVVRAAIIISLIYLAQFLGKRFDIWRALLFAIWLMLVISPNLLSSISFQLSVAAMSGILVFEKKLPGLRKIPLIGREAAESLGAQLMVLPVIGYHFGQVSWAAPLINMLVLPLVPWIMLSGLIGLAGAVSAPLAIPFLYLGYPLLWLFVFLIEKAGRFPWLQASFAFPWWLVVIYYLVLFGLISRGRKENEKD